MEHSIRHHKQFAKWELLLKRVTDMIISVASLLLLSPLLVVIALSIKLTSLGPILYEWNVVGKHDKRFRSYKFRTMIVGADELKRYLRHQNEMTGPVFKMKKDPRATPVGRILRKFSLDELPQLWSVLKGDMSLVGPRPVGPQEWEHFEEWQRRKLSVTPGMICLWHIRGKPEDFNEWIKLDLEYIDNWSIWLDLRLLCGAVWYVISGSNY